VTRAPQSDIELCLRIAMCDACAVHGDLDLSEDVFVRQVCRIIEKHTDGRQTATSGLGILSKLYTSDLYLAIACAEGGEAAWLRFCTVYAKYIRSVALFDCASADRARELADAVISGLFLPGTSGISRIASYDGRSSLASWLRVIVSNRASDLRNLKFNTFEPFSSIPESKLAGTARLVETNLRANRYANAITASFKAATARLSSAERFLLSSRYERGLGIAEIADILAVNPSTVTRRIQKAQQRLGTEIIDALATRCHLSRAAIDECVEDILENGSHSILSFICVGDNGSYG
jgi:RNA polymerase sigma-70 factor (ECF subfamily)